MRIAVYSGSFNPLHIGHRAIISFLIEKLGFDMVYLVVSPRNPLKDQAEDASGRKRFRAACEAVGRIGIERVKVDDIELGMPAPQYSYRTLDALRLREPENTFTLVMGADNLSIIHKWREYRKILSEYGIVVFPRRGYDSKSLADKLIQEFESEGLPCRIEIAEAPLVDISSTEIREGLSNGQDMSNVLF